MRQEIATKWAEALESGEYEQGHGALAFSNRHCCLGVLCELAIADGVDVPKAPAHDGTIRITYGSQASALPDEVQEWAGMQTSEGTLPNSGRNTLAGHNDDGVSFSEIAEIIRENADAL